MKSKIEEYLKSCLLQCKEMNIGTNIFKIDFSETGLSIKTEKMFQLNKIFLIASKTPSEDKVNQDFLWAYLLKAKTFEFLEDIFEELYKELTILVDNKLYTFRTIGYLPELKIDGELDLGKCKIMPINIEYLEFFYNMYYIGKLNDSVDTVPSLRYKDIYTGTLVIIEHTANDFCNDNSNRKVIENVLKSIVLNQGVLKSFEVTPFYTFSYFYQHGLIVRTDFIYLNSQELRTSAHSTINNLSRVKTIFDILSSLSSSYIFIDRIISASSKDTNEDKFLDLMIALESIFPSVKSEVSFKLSLYTASILKVSYDSFKKIKKLYNLRSNIVHGDSDLVNEETLELLDFIVRSVVVYTLEEMSSGKSLVEIENKIQESLFPFENTVYVK